ncbi:MAG: hypothetical protein SGJ19_02240 [Planctomycetia bacterium]|nr:hypothetical protein [Planctomycetia bacterium]
MPRWISIALALVLLSSSISVGREHEPVATPIVQGPYLADYWNFNASPFYDDVRTSQTDITQARLHLGYEPQLTFEEGLRRSIEFYLA